MASALSVDLRARVVAAVEEGASRRQAAKRFGVSLRYSDEAGRGFRFEAGRHSEAKPATVPI